MLYSSTDIILNVIINILCRIYSWNGSMFRALTIVISANNKTDMTPLNYRITKEYATIFTTDVTKHSRYNNTGSYQLYN